MKIKVLSPDQIQLIVRDEFQIIYDSKTILKGSVNHQIKIIPAIQLNKTFRQFKL